MAVLLPTMSTTLSLPPSHMTDAQDESVSSGSLITNSDPTLTPMPIAKKPKLSLQTVSLSSTYGSLTRGLAANPQSIYTPTTTNTLSNTWDLSYRSSPISRTGSPKPLQISRLQSQTQQDGQPYSLSLPFGVRPILKNSPFRVRASSVSGSPRDSKRRLFFPQPKKVEFRRNLEDLIHNTQYIAKHSDLTSSEDDSEDEEAPEAESTVEDNAQTSPPPTRKRKERRDSGVYIGTENIEEGSTSKQQTLELRSLKSCKRRRRQWSLSTSKSTLPSDEADRQPSDEGDSVAHDDRVT